MGDNAVCTIGVTSVGSGIGQSIVDAGRLFRWPLLIMGMRASPSAFGAFGCDVRAALPLVRAADDLGVLHKGYRQPSADKEPRLLSQGIKRFRDDNIEMVLAGTTPLSSRRLRMESP